jgi:hypothetical protein
MTRLEFFIGFFTLAWLDRTIRLPDRLDRDLDRSGEDPGDGPGAQMRFVWQMEHTAGQCEIAPKRCPSRDAVTMLDFVQSFRGSHGSFISDHIRLRYRQ